MPTNIDARSPSKKKFDTNLRPYRILGACNPQMALPVLLAGEKIGAMQAINNPTLAQIANKVRQTLKEVIDDIEPKGRSTVRRGERAFAA